MSKIYPQLQLTLKYFTKFSLKVVQPRKIKPQAKRHNFAFKNSNIVIKGIIQKRKDYFLQKNFETQK